MNNILCPVSKIPWNVDYEIKSELPIVATPQTSRQDASAKEEQKVHHQAASRKSRGNPAPHCTFAEHCLVGGDKTM